MSLLVFPLNIKFTTTFPIKQTPVFNTIVQIPASGRNEIRIPTMQFPRWDFVLDFSYITGDAQGSNSIWQQFINFYMGVQGQAGDWLFLHPFDHLVGSYTVTGAVTSGVFQVHETLVQTSTGATAEILFAVTGSNTMTIGPYSLGTPDNTHTWVGQTSGAVYTPTAIPVLATSQAIATGDGVTTAFTMIRTFVTGGAQDMIQNFVVAPSIYDNGSLVNPVNYTLDQYGTLTFTVAPVAAHTISWTGVFYYRCRFKSDSWDSMQEDYYQIWTADGIKFISVLL